MDIKLQWLSNPYVYSHVHSHIYPPLITLSLPLLLTIRLTHFCPQLFSTLIISTAPIQQPMYPTWKPLFVYDICFIDSHSFLNYLQWHFAQCCAGCNAPLSTPNPILGLPASNWSLYRQIGYIQSVNVLPARPVCAEPGNHGMYYEYINLLYRIIDTGYYVFYITWPYNVQRWICRNNLCTWRNRKISPSHLIPPITVSRSLVCYQVYRCYLTSCPSYSLITFQYFCIYTSHCLSPVIFYFIRFISITVF